MHILDMAKAEFYFKRHGHLKNHFGDVLTTDLETVLEKYNASPNMLLPPDPDNPKCSKQNK